MRRLWLVFVVLLILSLLQAEDTFPPKPLTPNLIDIPGDGGNNVYISWKHFATVPGIRYDILRYTTGKDYDKHRSTDDAKFEVITPLQVKTQLPVLEDELYNDLSPYDFYIYTQPQENDVPKVIAVKLTDENRDSILALGAQKIVRVELEVPPREILDKIPNIFGEGAYYLILPDTLIANVYRPKSVPENVWEFYWSDLPYEGDLSLELKPSQKELDFVDKGVQLLLPGEIEQYYLFKYGKRIISLVTDSVRYTVKYDNISFLQRSSEENPIYPDSHYVYKVCLVQTWKPIKKVFMDSDTVGITPKNEPPIIPNALTALYDSTNSELVLRLSYSGFLNNIKTLFDNVSYSIYKAPEGMETMPVEEDSIEEESTPIGELLFKVSSTWKAVKLNDIKPNDNIFLVMTDTIGQTTKSDFIPFNPVTAESLVLPPNIIARDKGNDEGDQAILVWDYPELAIKYSVENPTPNLRTENVQERKLYWIPAQDGSLIEISDTIGLEEIPYEAQEVVNIIYPIPLDKLNVRVVYEMWSNEDDKALYGEFRFNDKRKVDKEYTGEMEFENVKPGTYTLIGRVVKKSGGLLKNPESKVEIEISVNKISTTKFDKPDYYYAIYRGTDPEDLTTFKYVGKADGTDREFTDDFGDWKDAKGEFYYIVQVIGPSYWVARTVLLGPVHIKGNWFNFSKLPIFFAVFIFVAVALFFVYHIKKGREFYVRPIAGIVHIDEALGRATEMGRPIMYVAGLGWIGDIATICSMTILGKVASKAAEYQNRLIVPCYDPIVMIVAQETVKNAFMDAGRPDLYSEEDIYYIAAAQFAYAAAVSGLMIREQTAANFFMGRFYAESLILAETGASTGAIQVAGTDDMTQLPFFLTSCDYTLIGEELYAASAYLSKDPMQKGSLKAQDYLKALEMLLLIIGVAAATSGIYWFTNIFKAVGTE